MKILWTTALAVLLLAALAPAAGSGRMSAKKCSMQGLSKDEVKQAEAMEKAWSKAERGAWNKRCSLCMADPHVDMMKMQKDGQEPTPEQIHDHMVGGLSKAQAAAMEQILADKTNADLLMKMAKNCCMYGAQHAKKPKTP